MPLVTLLSGAALGAGVLIASILSPSSTASATGYGATPAASATTAAAPPASSASAATSATASGTAAATTPGTTSATAPASGSATTSGTGPVGTGPTGTGPATAAGTAPAATASAQKAGVPPKADYVSQVNGGGAAVAISVHAGKAVAYVCNGHAVAAWLRGTVKAGKLELTGKNGARLDVSYRTGKATGSITADGTKYSFSAPVVHSSSSEHRRPGLYEATAMVHGVPIKAGWVVLPNGSQIGSVEYFPGSDVAPTAQAPVLDLTTGTAQYDGITLVASLISGSTGSGF